VSPGTPTKVISAALGLCAFATATAVGLWVDNPADTVLGRAIVSMLLAQLVGMALGAVAERAVKDHIDAQHRSESATSAPTAPVGTASAR
jgi:hypothetical protein